MYASGEGVHPDAVMALGWIHKSVEQDYTEAQDKLGHFYETGTHVETDLVRAHLWFSLAASHSIKESAESKDRVARQLNEIELKESQRRVEMWKKIFQNVF